MLRLRLVDGMSKCVLGDGLARGYKPAQVYGAHDPRSVGLTEDRNPSVNPDPVRNSHTPKSVHISINPPAPDCHVPYTVRKHSVKRDNGQRNNGIFGKVLRTAKIEVYLGMPLAPTQ